jgi:hypothetical protein
MSLLLPLLGAGLVIVGVVAFWSAIQNWMSDLINRMSDQLARHTAQSALVILDRIIVNGQRLFVVTARAQFSENETKEVVTVEEVKRVAPENLPADVRAKLEAGKPLQYELSIGSMKVQHEPTYRLVVKRSE